MPGPIELVVYTAEGCCLCDDARTALEPLAAELDLAVRWVYIDGDAELEAAWREQLPAGVIRGRKVFKYLVDPEFLRRRAHEIRSEQAF
jgi:hypothetical protein